LNSGLTSQRTLDLEGLTGAAFASYGQEVLRIYREAWRPPDELNDDTATATVKITVLRNGTIRSAKIVSRSGNSTLDNSVQEALNRVRRLPPFPSGSSDSERVFSINFNLKSIRQF
jgi:protein TonB